MNQLSKNEALKKLKEAKEQLDLELIAQEEYDKLKEELKDIVTNNSENEEDIQVDNDTDSKNSGQKPQPPKFLIALVWIISLGIVWWSGLVQDILGIGGKGCVQKTHYMSGTTVTLKGGGKGSIEGWGDYKSLRWGFNESETKVWITYMTSNGEKTYWYRVDGCDLKR